jgi:DNA primase
VVPLCTFLTGALFYFHSTCLIKRTINNFEGVTAIATRIPEEFINEVSSKTNIVDVISRYVQLKKQGKQLMGLCPFHEERTPSFSVSEEKQFFHCFSCGRGGNVFKFIMEEEQKSFPEAVIEVAEMSNINVPSEFQGGGQSTNNSQHHTYLTMYEDVAKLYSHVLTKTEGGTQALKYLHNRNIDDEMINTFDIGYAPNNSNLLLQFFKDRDIDESTLRKSGLFAENENGEIFDRFRDRVMIPIKDETGHIIAFSGRILNKAQGIAKYMNSPETPIFDKGKTLFNLDLAKKSIRDKKSVILFEGFMDVMSAYRAGVTNGVASMGTSLTDQQLYSLSRLTDQINVCYDGDDPGVEATYRALTQLNDDRFEYGVISIPDKKDPDEFIRSEGAEKFRQLTDNSVQMPISFILNYFKRNYNLSNDRDKMKFLDQALQEIVKLRSPVEVDMYVGRLADELNLTKDIVNAQMTIVKRKQNLAKPANNYQNVQKAKLAESTANVPQKFDRIEKSERNLLYWAFDYPEIRVRLSSNDFEFVHSSYQKIFDALIAYEHSHGLEDKEIDPAQFSNVLDSDSSNIVSDITFKEMPSMYSDDEINDYFYNIQNSGLEFQLSDINRQLKKAAMVGDNKLQLELAQKLINVRKLLSND